MSIPIAALLPRLAPREHRALGGHDDAGDVVELVAAFAGLEEVDLFDERLGSSGRQGERGEGNGEE